MEQNRSERAKQVDLLAPALASLNSRLQLLRKFGIDKPESDQAEVFHFVWILRDRFSFERDIVSMQESTQWPDFFRKWSEILDLPEWVANDQMWWMDHSGRKNQPRIIHPCSRALGWTDSALKSKTDPDQYSVLSKARMVMNTECDCFIQTPNRLIVIECKDKTGFSREQFERQNLLKLALQRLFKKPTEPLALYITDRAPSIKYPGWSWSDIESALGT